MNTNLKIGFLGAGKMATALAKGFINARLIKASNILASDVSDVAREAFAMDTASKTTPRNQEVLKFAQVILLAVKPNQVAEVLHEVRQDFTKHHLLVSIAAGVTLSRLAEALPAGVRIIRVMPNTPALVGASATAYAAGPTATPEDARLVHQLFSAVGVTYLVKESLLDAVTGLSGSGPAYVYMIIEALSDGGVAAGLSREVATKLAAQTVLGAARMVLETGLHPGALKDQVTSPAGTTIEGIFELEKAGLRAAMMNAVRVGAEKSRRLGQG